MNAIFKRKSVRNFLSKTVEDFKIENILKAAMQAPSAGNQQPWEFIVVRNKVTLEKLSAMSPYAGMIKDADVAIVLVAHKKFIKFAENIEHDMSACTENILLQVVEEGLGAVWLSAIPLQERMKHITGLFNLSDDVIPFAVVPIGYPASESEVSNRFDTSRIHYEKY
ncbi:MAG: nitroreductase [Spirochaetes bacterium GWF1_31_7]|nr:MAG: nitroreductase [Spirochaetes bacterium GWE1_32_154]OHD49145.1 MAG: nitroreductase [Spirochaetes bacterium GWF1_31_7]OHD50270.1 MAG: nitroreductase [Spirochaetes bacterium GWE2_31_10]OHD76592.1 MAG: nitroreductase [Spirochaetes bacterium RIFOXYB1_FULL_32_8]HBD93946.1 nitroreductase family protein [Spirochaetia bacterium]